MTQTQQISFRVPEKSQMEQLYVERGMHAGLWEVNRGLLTTSDGKIATPYGIGLTVVQFYNRVSTDRFLAGEGLRLAPFPVLMYGIQHDERFYRMLLDTYQLTGSGVVNQGNNYLMGTPRITKDLQFNELRSDEPIARVRSQNGQVERLDTTVLWGVDPKSRVESEKVEHPTYNRNASGNHFVDLDVGSDGDVFVLADWDPLGGLFDGGVRLARKLE